MDRIEQNQNPIDVRALLMSCEQLEGLGRETGIANYVFRARACLAIISGDTLLIGVGPIEPAQHLLLEKRLIWPI